MRDKMTHKGQACLSPCSRTRSFRFWISYPCGVSALAMWSYENVVTSITCPLILLFPGISPSMKTKNSLALATLSLHSDITRRPFLGLRDPADVRPLGNGLPCRQPSWQSQGHRPDEAEKMPPDPAPIGSSQGRSTRCGPGRKRGSWG